MGGRQFDARARSLPTHAIKTPLTRPLRSLGNDPTKRTATQRQQPSNVRKHRERPHQHRWTRKERDRSKGQRYSEGQPTSAAQASHHARVPHPQPLHYETGKSMPHSALRTRDASGSPKHGGLSMQASAWQKATAHGQQGHRTMPSMLSVALALHYKTGQTNATNCAAHKRYSSKPGMGVSPHWPKFPTDSVAMARGHRTMPRWPRFVAHASGLKAANASSPCTGVHLGTPKHGAQSPHNSLLAHTEATGWGHRTMPGRPRLAHATTP